MTSRVLTCGAGLFIAGLFASAMAAVPDPSPFTWSRPVPEPVEVVLPDLPPPPRSYITLGRAGADIVLATLPRVSAPCADRGTVSQRVTASQTLRRQVDPAV